MVKFNTFFKAFILKCILENRLYFETAQGRFECLFFIRYVYLTIFYLNTVALVNRTICN